MEMLHESSLVHDDVCDGSLMRRDAASVPAAFGIRTAARAGFHLAGNALQVLARVIADNPAIFSSLGEAHGVTYLDQLADLSLGQLVETLPAAADNAALRRHYEFVAGAKTGTLFRLCCSYGGTAGGVDDDQLRALMRYADQLALAFQITDDVRDVEGGPALGKAAGGDLDRRVPDLAGDRMAGPSARLPGDVAVHGDLQRRVCRTTWCAAVPPVPPARPPPSPRRPRAVRWTRSHRLRRVNTSAT